MSTIYLDTSAFMRAFLSGADDHESVIDLFRNQSVHLVSSELLWLEADRACVRIEAANPAMAGLASSVATAYRHLAMIPLDRTTIRAARAIPQVIKSLDAIHVAAAESIRGALDCVVTYDKTMKAVLCARGIAACSAREVA